MGASANVVAINLARASGYHIGFMQFFRYGIFVSVLTLLVSTGYVWLRYYPSRRGRRRSDPENTPRTARYCVPSGEAVRA